MSDRISKLFLAADRRSAAAPGVYRGWARHRADLVRAAGLAALVVLVTARSALAIDTCVECHVVLPGNLNKPVQGMKGDIHAEKGLSCVDCHGGDATTMDESSMSKEKGFRGKVSPADVPGFCGRCHADGAYMRQFNPRLPTDQLAQYGTSVHGQRLRQGDTKLATCISCHGVHGILPASRAESRVFPPNVPSTCGHCHSDAQYMAGYGIPTDQELKYKGSVHADMLLNQRDLSAPACNDCHGNHGAFPPGVASVAEVCGQCHVNNAALFIRSPHKKAFDDRKLPECAECHSNHDIHRASDAMIGGDEATVCRRCHPPGTKPYDVATRMRFTIENLRSVMNRTETLLARAATMGMEVSEEKYAFDQSVPAQLVKVRTETHLASLEAVTAAAASGLETARASTVAAEATLAEANARRRNLVIPLAVIVLVMSLLYAKLRQLERRK